MFRRLLCSLSVLSVSIATAQAAALDTPRLQGIDNFRDIAGTTDAYATAHDGTMRAGVFYRTAGKDRTVWTAAVLRSIAGVDSATIMSKHLATNDYTAARVAKTEAYATGIPGACRIQHTTEPVGACLQAMRPSQPTSSVPGPPLSPAARLLQAQAFAQRCRAHAIGLLKVLAKPAHIAEAQPQRHVGPPTARRSGPGCRAHAQAVPGADRRRRTSPRTVGTRPARRAG